MDYRKICDRTIEIVREVGRYIVAERLAFDKGADVRHKSLNNLVTHVDVEAEKRLIAGFKALLPESSFLAEESQTEFPDADLVWIIDPIDGTTNFVHNLPFFCTSVALMHKGELVVGVIYDMLRDECFHASKGGGAFSNGAPIRVSDAELLRDSLLATGFPYSDFDLVEFYIAVFKDFMRNGRGIRRLGSAAMDLAYVACGRFDGFYEYNLSPWDVAAGIVLIREAGGRITDFRGGDNMMTGKEIVASNGHIQDEMLELIRLHFYPLSGSREL